MGSGESFSVSLPVGLNKDNGQLQPATPGPLPPHAITTATDGIQWFDIKKDFGPLNLSRVGFKLSTTGGVELTGYLDGGLSLMGLTVELLGLTVSTTLTGTSKFKPTFGLNGLGIDFKEGPLEIGGALYKLTDNNVTEFDGLAIIRTENLQLSAIGSFAELSSGDKSLFIYAVLDYPLGGPAFFFVTGLAAGFGYNRRLLIPDVSQVKQFPLIAEAMAAQPAPPTTDMSQMKDFISGKISGMQSYIPPQVGEYFLAVGVRFTSFETVGQFRTADGAIRQTLRSRRARYLHDARTAERNGDTDCGSATAAEGRNYSRRRHRAGPGAVNKRLLHFFPRLSFNRRVCFCELAEGRA